MTASEKISPNFIAESIEELTRIPDILERLDHLSKFTRNRRLRFLRKHRASVPAVTSF